MAHLQQKFRKIRLASTASLYITGVGALAYSGKQFYENWLQIKASNEEINFRFVRNRIYQRYQRNLEQQLEISLKRELQNQNTEKRIENKAHQIAELEQRQQNEIQQIQNGKILLKPLKYNTLEDSQRQNFQNEYFEVFQSLIDEITKPLSKGDQLHAILSQNLQELQKTDIDSDKDVLFYRAHCSIKDMYSDKVLAQIQQVLENELPLKYQHIQTLYNSKYFGGDLDNQEEISQVFNSIRQGFSYSLIEPVNQTLFLGRLDGKQIEKLVKDFKQKQFDGDQDRFAVRMEEYLDKWIEHLDEHEIPKLQKVHEQIQYEHLKIVNLIQYIEQVNEKFKEVLNRGYTVQFQQNQLTQIVKDFQDRFTKYMKKNSPRIQFEIESNILKQITDGFKEREQHFNHIIPMIEQNFVETFNQSSEVHDRLYYALQIRKLCSILQDELKNNLPVQGDSLETQQQKHSRFLNMYSQKQALIQELGESEDPLVKLVIERIRKDEIDKDETQIVIPPQESLVQAFGDIKKQASMHIFAPQKRNKIQQLYGRTMMILKEAIIGNIYQSYMTQCLINDDQNESMVSKLQLLDHAQHFLIQGKLKESLVIIEMLGNGDKELDKIFEDWIQHLKRRIERQDVINILNIHSDIISENGIAKIESYEMI